MSSAWASHDSPKPPPRADHPQPGGPPGRPGLPAAGDRRREGRRGRRDARRALPARAGQPAAARASDGDPRRRRRPGRPAAMSSAATDEPQIVLDPPRRDRVDDHPPPHRAHRHPADRSTGATAARSLAPALAGQSFALVLVSPSRRARETCELAGLGAPARPEREPPRVGLRRLRRADDAPRSRQQPARLEPVARRLPRRRAACRRRRGGPTARSPRRSPRRGPCASSPTATCCASWEPAGPDWVPRRAPGWAFPPAPSACSATSTAGGSSPAGTSSRADPLA